MSTLKRVVVMSDDEESSDYDKRNISFNNLESTFRVGNIRHHSPESTTEQVANPLPIEKPKRVYRKKTTKEKEEVKQGRERKRSQKKESDPVQNRNDVESNVSSLEISSSLCTQTKTYTQCLEENNRTIRELLSKVNAYETILTELGHNPIQLWKSKTL